MLYTLEDRFTQTLVYVKDKNTKDETMLIEISHCKDPGGKSSLPHLWYKNGWLPRVFDTYLCCRTYVTDSEGNCFEKYNPTIKLSDDGKRNVINFDWMMEDTPENMQKIINACIRLFKSAKGKSATEKKMDKIRAYAKERNLEITYEFPEGWRKLNHVSDPVGCVTIDNGKCIMKKTDDGKFCINPNHKKMLLVL